MRFAKSTKTTLLTRNFEYQGRFYLGIGVVHGFDFAGQFLYSEAKFWEAAQEDLPEGVAPDEVLPKTQAEYLVCGHAYAPNGQAVAALSVGAEVAGSAKSLTVSGNRWWQGAQATAPQPFTHMPLVWERAWGGADMAENPLGCGARPMASAQGTVHALPNVELAGQELASAQQRPVPGGLLPRLPTHPERLAMAGSFDQRWLEDHYPGFPPEMDWRYFNVAPLDQQFGATFSGGEAFAFSNMHPHKPRTEGQLPSFKARCFAVQAGADRHQFVEIPLARTTAWFFPHREMGLIIEHGYLEVADEEADDVYDLVAGAEEPHEPREPDHYYQVLKKRQKLEQAPEEAVNDADLLPAWAAVQDPLTAAQLQGIAMEGLAQKRAAAMPLAAVEPTADEEDLLGSESPDEPGASEGDAGAEAESATQDDEIPELVALAAALADLPEPAPSRGPPLALLAAEERPDEELAEPGNTAEPADSGASEAGQDASDEGTEEPIEMPDLRALNVQADESSRAAYRLGAHLQQPVAAMDADASAALKSRVFSAASRGESLAGMNLTGADLSGIDLGRADLADAWMESTTLTNTKLDSARLDRAVLARSKLDRVSLRGASLNGVNLGQAVLRGVMADEKTLIAGAILAAAQFSECRLAGLRIEDSVLDDAQFISCELNGLHMPGAAVTGLLLDQVSLHKAELSNSQFVSSRFEATDFSGAALHKVVFSGVQAAACRFAGARMSGVVAVSGSDFSSADFTGSDLRNANFRGMNLAGANFSEAQLDGADFSYANCQGASFHRAIAVEARFHKADLGGCSFVSANLTRAVFKNALLPGADLRGSNLYQADLARVFTDPGTQFGEAFLQRARTKPSLSRSAAS